MAKHIRIGLVFDRREDYRPYQGAPDDYFGEFDTEETIAAVEETIRSLGYEVFRIGHFKNLVELVASGAEIDLVFNLAEGVWGRAREAQVPALLEAYGIPYTGSDPLTLAISLDKGMTKRLWQCEGLPTSPFAVISSPAELENGWKGDLPDFPVFVKPVHEGSSKGISRDNIIDTREALSQRIREITAHYQQPALVEKFLPGREYTVGLIGSGVTARVIGMMEITEVQTYVISGFVEKEEWETLAPDTYQPISAPDLRQQLAELSLQAYKVLGCRDLGRIDIRCDAAGNPQLLEVNPLPGMHPTHSAWATTGRFSGIAYEALVEEIIQAALARSSV